MSNLIRSVSIQHLKHQYELFLRRFYEKLLLFQPKIYVVSNITTDAVHLQVTWKSSSRNDYITYNSCTTYNSDYLSAINKMCEICTYALEDAELLADSPFVGVFLGMPHLQQKIENSPLESLLRQC